MQSTRFASLFLLLLASQILTGCGSPAANQNANAAPTNTSSSVSNVVPKDNSDEFALIVSLPFEPEEVAWNEKPETHTLTAVIRFSGENASKMSAELAKNGTGTPETLAVETWYPAELLAQAELSGESSIKGTSYAADSMLNPPYSRGKITRIENTDYFVLHISA